MDSLAQDRELVPRHVRTHGEMARFHHEDIPDLTDDEIRAEEVLATVQWSGLVYQRRRPRLMAGAVTDEKTWLEDRVRRLKAEQRRRQTSADRTKVRTYSRWIRQAERAGRVVKE